MTRLLLRYFLICVVVTVFLFTLLLYVYSLLDDANTLANTKLITQGKFFSLDEYLKKYPSQQWQAILDKLHPQHASVIKIVPLEKLELTDKQKKDIKANKIVDVFHQDDPKHPQIVYKKTRDNQLVYQDHLEFNDSEKAQRYFGWVPILILDKLNSVPKTLWPQTLQALSHQYGYPLAMAELDKLNLNKQQKSHLKNKEWIVDLPYNNDSVQTLYVPTSDNKILIVGPINLPFYGVYQKYILLICGLLAIELIIFVWAMLFSRTLTKLNKLADAYGKGNFESNLKVSKTSTLFGLFHNLQIMGMRIKKLINSHKELTNAVSHELRTPISRLRFSLHALRESNDLDEIDTHAAMMEEDIVELEDLVTEVMTYARLDRTDLELKYETIILVDLIKVALKKLQTQFDKQIITDFDRLQRQAIQANPKYLLRALENLLRNACRFAKEKVRVSLRKVDKRLHLIIEDDGVGISDQDKQRVFMPFVQLHNQVDEENGFGLGLAIAKKIIDQHHWTIRIDDSDLGGAKVVIIL